MAQALSQKAWLLAWLFRAILALFIVSGADVPDEWWQSTEVAEHVVFGKGELTWEWRDGLRSYTYPLPFIAVFKLFQFLGIDKVAPSLLYYAPRLMAATVCFLVDRAAANVAWKYIYPRERAFALTLMLTLASWFTGFVGVRTQSNVVEALMLLWALEVDSFVAFVLCCGLGCALRVTFAIPAVVLFVHRIYDRCFVVEPGVAATGLLPSHTTKKAKTGTTGSNRATKGKVSDDDDDDDEEEEEQGGIDGDGQKRNNKRNLDHLIGLKPRNECDDDESLFVSLAKHLGVTAVAAGLTLFGIAAIDRIFYGRWLCSPLNFLTFNVVSGLSKLFGTHPAHWYFSSALPLMFFTYIPIIGFGIKHLMASVPPTAYSHKANADENAKRTTRFAIRLMQIVGVSSVAMSFLGHKEMRFLFFTVPLAALVAAACWSTDPTLWRQRKRWTTFHVLVNVLVLLFFGLLWQQAPLSVASHLRRAAYENPAQSQRSFHALTHCFALPGESFFHGAVSEFVHNTCPVVLAETANTQEQNHPRYSIVQPTASDTFLESPLEFVEYIYEGRAPASPQFQRRMDLCCERRGRQMPDRLVIYDVHHEVLRPFLERNYFAKRKSFFHTWFPLENYQGKWMILFERQA